MPAVGLYEFKQLMSQACSMPLSTAELELALRTCSTGGNAAMTFEDWCRWWSRTLSSLKQTRCDAITSARDRWEAEGVDRIDI